MVSPHFHCSSHFIHAQTYAARWLDGVSSVNMNIDMTRQQAGIRWLCYIFHMIMSCPLILLVATHWCNTVIIPGPSPRGKEEEEEASRVTRCHLMRRCVPPGQTTHAAYFHIIHTMENIRNVLEWHWTNSTLLQT